VPGAGVPNLRAASVGTALASGAARLRKRERFGASPSEASFDARVLLEHILERNSAWLLAHDDSPLADADRARFEAAIRRRLRGEPVAYIVGTAGFFGRTFAVDSNVLVPRPETEGAVELVLANFRADGYCLRPPMPGRRPHSPGVRICDVGAGSGCIAVSLACELPDARVTAIDISPQALTVARANARAFGVDDRIVFVAGNGLAAADALVAADAFAAGDGLAATDGPTATGRLAGADPGIRFDCIVANLPYVKSADIAPAPDPTSFEPSLALDGGLDGLDAYRELLAAAPARLEPGGLLVMEGGPDTVPALAELAARAFPGGWVTKVRDGAGLDRFAVVATEARR
jgi:release factor glutamine methyltransferase